ncbi:MAG: universal stress protein, partial [Legionellales bacterium]|nr:universal stress protein [Legionellales bacterium]
TTVDLLIIGSHGRYGWSKLLGSSTQAVISHVSCDVLTVYSHSK